MICHISIPDAIYADIADYCERYGISMSRLACNAMTAYMANGAPDDMVHVIYGARVYHVPLPIALVIQSITDKEH